MGHGAHAARGAAGGRAGALDPRWCSITSSVSTSRGQSAGSMPWITPWPAMPRKSVNDRSLTSQLLWHKHSTSCAVGSDAAKAGSDPSSVIVLSMSCLSTDWHGEGGTM
jgi:hypothetical protein